MNSLLQRLLADQRRVEVETDAAMADVEEVPVEDEAQHDEEAEAQLVDELAVIVSAQDTVGVTSLVEQLGPFLTSEDPIPRVRATAVLCEVLRKLEDNENKLGAVQIKTLLHFFMNRYQTDWEAALACLKGLQTLLMRNTFIPEAVFENDFARDLLTCVLTNHNVTELSQTIRALVFDITRLVLTKYAAFVSQSQNDPWLSSAFAAAMSGEKDPRCLLVCLDILRMMLRTPQFGGEAFVEDAFEVTSVYFPITFRPPPNDPFGITHEALVETLNSVFCANPAMVNCTLPMALDRLKMTSTEAAPARIEALRLIACCAKTFDAIILAPFLTDLRDSIVGLILSPEEEELATEALNTLKVLVRLVAPRGQVNAKDMLWEEFALVTLRRCGMALEASIDSMAASGAARILVGISESCSIGFSTTLRGLLPLLENFFRSINNGDVLVVEKPLPKKVAAMDLIRSMARCVDPLVGHLPGEGPIDPFASRLFSIAVDELQRTVGVNENWMSSADESHYVVSCALAMRDLVCRPNNLAVSVEQITDSASLTLLERVLLPLIRSKFRAVRKEVVGAALLCLRDFDVKCKDSKLLSNRIVTVLLNEAKISATSEHFDEMGGEMKDRLEIILTSLPVLCQASEDESIPRSIVEFLVIDSPVPKNMALPILPRLAKAIPKVETMEKCFLSSSELFQEWMSSDTNAELLSVLCERASPAMNEKLVRISVDAFKLSSPPHLDKGCEACLLAMRRDYDFVLPNLLNVLDLNRDVVSNEAFLRVFASAINKAPSGAVLNEAVERLFGMVDTFSPKEAARLFGRAFKALTLRSCIPPADKMGKFLQSLLHAEELDVASEAAVAFGSLVLVHKGNDGLDVPFARSQGVARQRAFEKWFTILHEDLSTSQKSSDALLNACAALAAGAPNAVLLESLKIVIPIMVRASKSENEATRLSALRILKSIMKDESESVGVHLSTLVPFLLKFTAGQERAMNCLDRLDALEVLEILPQHLPYHKLHPYRATVSSALSTGALDDPKRAVRQKAVECREKWAMFASS